MSTRLDPEEALATPLYVVALMIVVVPVVDFVLTVPPAEPSSIQWRFSAVGLLSDYTIMPVLGLALALVVSAVTRHVAMQRLLVIICLMVAVVLFALSSAFFLDMRRVRPTVTAEGLPAFNSAWTRAIIKNMLAAATLAYLGWRARRMLPVRGRHRGAKPVIVVPK